MSIIMLQFLLLSYNILNVSSYYVKIQSKWGMCLVISKHNINIMQHDGLKE